MQWCLILNGGAGVFRLAARVDIQTGVSRAQKSDSTCGPGQLPVPNIKLQVDPSPGLS